MDRGEAGRRFADAAADLVTTSARSAGTGVFPPTAPQPLFTIVRVSHALSEDGKCPPVVDAVEHWSS